MECRIIKLFLILLLLGCTNPDKERYEIFSIINKPENRNITYYPNINDKNLLIEGNDIIFLRKNASLFYKKYWTTSKGKRQYTTTSSINKMTEIINNPESDLEIELFSSRIALIKRTEYGFSSEDLVRVQDAWHLSDKRWKPILNHTNHFYKTRLQYLNDDDYIDIIIEGGCCDNVKYSIYLGDSKNNFQYIQDITVSGIPEIFFNGKCNNRIKANHLQKFLYSKTVYFDCKENKFKEVKSFFDIFLNWFQ